MTIDGFRCPKDGFYPNPTSCKKYYRCTGRIPYKFTCNEGLEYNAALNICDWPAKANCAITGTKSPDTKTTPNKPVIAPVNPASIPQSPIIPPAINNAQPVQTPQWTNPQTSVTTKISPPVSEGGPPTPPDVHALQAMNDLQRQFRQNLRALEQSWNNIPPTNPWDINDALLTATESPTMPNIIIPPSTPSNQLTNTNSLTNNNIQQQTASTNLQPADIAHLFAGSPLISRKFIFLSIISRFNMSRIIL